MKTVSFNLYNLVFQYGLPFFIALALSLIFTPFVRIFAIKYKFVAYPKQDRWRKRVVASLGGIAIFASFMIPYLIFNSYDLKFMGIIFGSMAIFTLGIIDDIVHIKPDTKLIGQIMVACITIMFGIHFDIYRTPLVNIPLTIFWIVGIINAFNLLDNMDGLCAGIVSISALILGIYSYIHNNSQHVILALIILGSALGFLRYNSSPAKIFMGDCGSMFLGFILATGALIGTANGRSGLLFTMAIPVLLLAVPIFDTILVTLTRTLNDRPISQGGRDHVSHRLVALGFSERKAVLFLYIISAICGLGVILYTKINFIVITIMTVIFFIALFMLGVFLGSEVKVYSEKEFSKLRSKKKFNGKIILNGFIYNKRRIVEVILDFIIISVSYVSAFLLRFEGVLVDANVSLILESLPIILIIKLLMFYSFGLYRGVWRYAGIYDVIAIFKSTCLSSLASITVLFFLFRARSYSRTVFVIDWFITFVSVSGVRILFRLYKEFFANIKLGGKRVLIFGAGDAGELLLREIRQNRSLDYKPIGFIDDDDKKMDRIIHGIKVIGDGGDLEKLVSKYKIDELLITIPNLYKKRVSEICEICRRVNIPFVEVSKIINIEK